MLKIIGISGSLRKNSYNTALLRAASDLAVKDLEIEIASIKDIPLYDGDIETSIGMPEPVENLKDKIEKSDGLLLACPEYNGSMSGVMKNTLDWLSRPPKDLRRIFKGKAVGILGATPGKWGTRMAQESLLRVMHSLGARVFSEGAIYVSGANNQFNEEGRLVDDELRGLLLNYLSGFVSFSSTHRS